MLVLTLSEGSFDNAMYLVDEHDKPIAKISIQQIRSKRQVGIGILAPKSIKILRDSLVKKSVQNEYDKSLKDT